jgi:hypothetical protein
MSAMNTTRPPSPQLRQAGQPLLASLFRRLASVNFLVVFVATSLLVSLAVACTFWNTRLSLFNLDNFVGPTLRRFLDPGIMEGTPTLRGARMPLATLVMAACHELVGDHYFRVLVIKLIAALVPVWAAVSLTIKALPKQGVSKYLCWALLLIPLVSSPFIANVVNLQVEEGYGFGPIAYCCAVLLFTGRGAKSKPSEGLVFGLSLSLVFLAKSAFVLLAFVLLACYGVGKRPWRHKAMATMLLIGTCLGWCSYQEATSGRFALGTSLDGFNFYKGNNEHFLDRYPPEPGTNLDMYDAELGGGYVITNEWTANDHFRNLAVQFMKDHPWYTAQAMAMKFQASMLSLTKYGSTAPSPARAVFETAGLVIFRLLSLAALTLIAYQISKGQPVAAALSWQFLLVGTAAMAPYLLGFAYTRHTSILLFPCSLYLVSILGEGKQNISAFPTGRAP